METQKMYVIEINRQILMTSEELDQQLQSLYGQKASLEMQITEVNKKIMEYETLKGGGADETSQTT